MHINTVSSWREIDQIWPNKKYLSTRLCSLYSPESCTEVDAWGPARVNSDRWHGSETAKWRSWNDDERQAAHAKFRQWQVNLPNLRRGKVWNSDRGRDIKSPLTGPLYRVRLTFFIIEITEYFVAPRPHFCFMQHELPIFHSSVQVNSFFEKI